MKQKKTNEELQSRREFFKKAAKAALPVVGAVVLSSMPIQNVVGASEPGLCKGCTSICTGACGGCTNCTGCTSCSGCTGCSLNCYGKQR